MSHNRTPSEKFKDTIEPVKGVHGALSNNDLPHTHASYGADDSEERVFFIAEDRRAWCEVIWRANGPLLDIPIDEWPGDSLSWAAPGNYSFAPPGDDGNGTFTLSNGSQLTIQEPAAPGDATVPEQSGEAPGKSGVKSSFRIGNQGNGMHNQDVGFEHQGAYNDERSRWATLYGIVKIARQAGCG